MWHVSCAIIGSLPSGDGIATNSAQLTHRRCSLFLPDSTIFNKMELVGDCLGAADRLVHECVGSSVRFVLRPVTGSSSTCNCNPPCNMRSALGARFHSSTTLLFLHGSRHCLPPSFNAGAVGDDADLRNILSNDSERSDRCVRDSFRCNYNCVVLMHSVGYWCTQEPRGDSKLQQSADTTSTPQTAL